MMADLDDKGMLSLDDSIGEIEKIISAEIKGEKFDYLFTHGKNGEYGHERHIGAHRAVKNMLKSGRLHAERVFYFNYIKLNRKKHPTMSARAESDYFLALKKNEYEKKREIVAGMYGYAPDGIDVGLCADIEGFKCVKDS